MANKKTSSTRAADTARKIWLAGIGAYGRAFSDAHGSLTRVGEETSKAFDDLVERGETIEDHSRDSAPKAASGNLVIEERIKRLRSKIGLPEDGRGALHKEMDDLKDQLDRIETKLDHLIANQKTGTGKSPTKDATTAETVSRKKATPKRSS